MCVERYNEPCCGVVGIMLRLGWSGDVLIIEGSSKQLLLISMHGMKQPVKGGQNFKY